MRTGKRTGGREGKGGKDEACGENTRETRVRGAEH